MRPHYTCVMRRDPIEHYDTVYEDYPGFPETRLFIDHPRKLNIINLCAYPWATGVEEIHVSPTCYDYNL